MSHLTFKLAALAASMVLAGLSPAATAQAATVYKATLLGANENPPASSPGGGVAFLTIDGDLMTVSTTFSNLVGDVTAAHIHCCAAAPANVGVATQTPSFPGFPTGVTSGAYSQAFDLDTVGTYNPTFVTAYGMEKARSLAAEQTAMAVTALENLPGDTAFFSGLADYLTERTF